MLERYLHALSCSDVGAEDPSVTRERLKERFPRGATRRMTQLGLLIGAALDELRPGPEDAIVYASAFAETRALEAYLDSFPTPSPTLFQTSIHPSAVQQVMIGRQQPVREFFPITGRTHLVAQALQTAALCAAPRVILCGGEERGTWLLEQGVASDRSFAFACGLSAESAGALARITLSPTSEPEPAAAFSLPEFFQTLTSRSPLSTVAAPGLQLTLTWL
jgi:hypothetical protein